MWPMKLMCRPLAWFIAGGLSLGLGGCWESEDYIAPASPDRMSNPLGDEDYRRALDDREARLALEKHNEKARPEVFAYYNSLPTEVTRTDPHGRPKGGDAVTHVGGHAVAVVDADLDGLDDFAIVNGTPFYFFVRTDERIGGLHFRTHRRSIGPTDDGMKRMARGFGLHDLDNDGLLDLYLANQGRETALDGSPLADDEPGRWFDAGYATWRAIGNGKYEYLDIGLEGAGAQRLAVFADFDSDGMADAYISTSPVWDVGGGSIEGNRLLPGTATGFGRSVLGTAVYGGPRDLWQDTEGRASTNFKGVVVRDFDRDGRPDLVTVAFADVWSGSGTDVAEEGLGYRGDWSRGIFLLHNQSSPGTFRFEDVSNRAIVDANGRFDEGHFHGVIPVDYDGDADLDFIAIGYRGVYAHHSMEYSTSIIRALRNDSTPGRLRFVDVTSKIGFDAMNGDEQVPGGYPQRGRLDGRQVSLFPSLTAGAAIDIENDGDADLVMVDRQVVREFDWTTVTGDRSAFVFRNVDGVYTVVAPERHGLFGTARELSYGDFNGDGRIDVVTVDGGGDTVETNRVYLNTVGDAGHWVSVRVSLPGNLVGIGTRVTARIENTDVVVGYDEIRTDFCYRSRRDARLHFGAGTASAVDLEFVLPNGEVIEAESMPVDRGYRLVVRELSVSSAGRVGLLSDERFDATNIKTASITCEVTGESRRDADGDGRRDLAIEVSGDCGEFRAMVPQQENGPWVDLVVARRHSP